MNLFLHLVESLPPLLSTSSHFRPWEYFNAFLFHTLIFFLQKEVLVRVLLLVCSYTLSKKPLGNLTSPEWKKKKKLKHCWSCIQLQNFLPSQRVWPGRGTLVRMTFLSLSMSGMVSKSLSSTELSVSDWHGCPPSEEDICLPGLELDSSETENTRLPSKAKKNPWSPFFTAKSTMLTHSWKCCVGKN